MELLAKNHRLTKQLTFDTMVSENIKCRNGLTLSSKNLNFLYQISLITEVENIKSSLEKLIARDYSLSENIALPKMNAMQTYKEFQIAAFKHNSWWLFSQKKLPLLLEEFSDNNYAGFIDLSSAFVEFRLQRDCVLDMVSRFSFVDFYSINEQILQDNINTACFVSTVVEKDYPAKIWWRSSKYITTVNIIIPRSYALSFWNYIKTY